MNKTLQAFDEAIENNMHIMINSANRHVLEGHADAVKEIYQLHKEECIKFVEYISEIGFTKYKEGWCQFGGSNGWHCSSEELFDIFISSKESN